MARESVCWRAEWRGLKAALREVEKLGSEALVVLTDVANADHATPF
jgi:hypothetical protein